MDESLFIFSLQRDFFSKIDFFTRERDFFGIRTYVGIYYLTTVAAIASVTHLSYLIASGGLYVGICYYVNAFIADFTRLMNQLDENVCAERDIYSRRDIVKNLFVEAIQLHVETLQ